MKRKGWHRKKRRLRHDHWAQFKNTLRNHCIRETERMFFAHRRFEELLAKKLDDNPGMGPFRASLEISREEVPELYSRHVREEVNAMGCKAKGKGGKKP